MKIKRSRFSFLVSALLLIPVEVSNVGAAPKNCADFDSSVETAQKVDNFISDMRLKLERYQRMQLEISSKVLRSVGSPTDESRKIWLDKSDGTLKFRDEKSATTTYSNSKKETMEVLYVSDGQYMYQVGEINFNPQSNPLKIVRHVAESPPNLIDDLIYFNVGGKMPRRLTLLADGRHVIEACFDGSDNEVRYKYKIDESTGLPAEGTKTMRFRNSNAEATWEFKVVSSEVNPTIDPGLFRYSPPLGRVVEDRVPEEKRLNEINKRLTEAWGKVAF